MAASLPPPSTIPLVNVAAIDKAGAAAADGTAANGGNEKASARARRNAAHHQHNGGHRGVAEPIVVKRTRRINIGPGAQNIKFAKNSVTTSKYNLISYLPKSLLEQFRRIANIYFLFISILQMSTDLSPTGKYATIEPLAVVLVFTMIKEGVEDLARHRADRKVNEARSQVVRDGVLIDVPWRAIRVGDIVRVRNDEPVPADIIVLSSSGASGVCHIETSNLDGETNLKVKTSLEMTQSLVWPSAESPEALRKLSSWAATLECEESNKDLYQFEGHLTVDGKRHMVQIKSVIWRGTSLVNTTWVYGLVFFTGQDTKLIRNSRAAPSKRSAIDKMVNTTVIVIFITLAVMATASTILSITFLDDLTSRADLWYLPFLVNENAGIDILRTWTTFLILYNNLVPISLYISLEFVKLFQARMIGEDVNMFHAESGSRAAARTSNLNDDLGQIQYIFSDKTGTLTCNKMEFHRCSVGGIAYGTDPNDDTQQQQHDDKNEKSVESKRASKLAGAPSASKGTLPQEATFVNVAPSGKKRAAPVAIEGYNFDDRQFLRDMRGDDKQAIALRDFLTALAVCHTVVPHTDEHGHHQYRASSPDEAALVIAAKQLGYEFWERSERMIRIRLTDGVILEFEVLAENEFTSDRRCMSTIIRIPATGLILLYAKGADEAMLPKLRADLQRSEEEVTMQTHLGEFGSEGLRTLVVCKTTIAPDVWYDWNRRYTDIRNDLHVKDKTASLAVLAAELEQDLELVGATAIEDKLQDGVPNTIHQLTQAGIKVWMLTGDKLETAQNIGLSCRLLQPDMTVVKINEATHDSVTSILAITLKKYQRSIGKSEDKLAILVSGKSLTYVFASDDLRNLFLQLCKMARVVVACRVIPSQKAELVKMVRFGVRPEPMTLAIGDGANDVAMIQEAHVGVGISGNEGMQAVRSSDYSFAQFRYLQRLLFVHGRWNYRRVSLLVLYSFYKNIAYILTLFCFGFHNSYSGTTLYEAFLSSGWNIGWTLLPILVVGILEQDIGATAAMLNPLAYGSGHRQMEFSITRMAVWVCNAVLHAIIIYVLGIASFKNVITAADGHGDGLFLAGTIINMCATLTVNIKISLVTKYWTRWNTAAVVLSIVIWCIFVAIYSSATTFSYDFFGIAKELFTRAHFWFIIIFVPITANIVDLCWLHISSIYYPNPVDIVREKEMLAKRAGDDDLAFQAAHERATHENNRAVASLPSPHHVRDVSYWAPHIAHLKDVLRGDKDAMQLKQKIGLELMPSLTTQVQRHWFTLAFVSHPALEQEFQKQYVLKSVRLTRVILVVVWLLLAIYAVWSAISRDAQYVFRLIATILALFALALAWTRYFRKYFNEFIFAVLLIGGMLRSILVTVEGAVGLGMFCILAYLLFRARFITSFIVTTFDLCFYVVWILIATSSSRYELLKAVFLDVLLLAFCAYCSHHIESAFRLDFLKQKDFQAEQSRTNSIVENILPPHIIAMQMAAVKARRDKAEQELAAYTQASRQAAGARTFSGFGAAPRSRKVAPTNGVTASPPTSVLGSARTSILQPNGGTFDQANVDMLRRTITSTNRKGGAAQLLLAHSTAHADGPMADLVPRHLTSPPAHARPPLSTHTPGGHNELKVVEVSLNGDVISEVKGNTMHGTNGVMASPSHTVVGNGNGFNTARSGAITPMDTKMDEDELDELGIFSPAAPPLPPGQEIEHFLSKELSDILVSVEGEVSVIFCDVLDMTVYMQRHSPSVVVAILDNIYSLFDELCVFHGVRKMETVGKTWMGAVGLRGTRKDHALAAVEMAIEMLEIMAKCTDPEKKSSDAFTGITCRIGVHTGYAISGVVGVRRPQFSLFGDTVNTAARVCSNGAENRLHISQPTWQHIHKHYECIPRQITAKGKGVLTTYFVAQRLSRIPLHRKLSYKSGLDEVPLSEVQRLIQISDPMHEDDEFDQYELPDQENPIEIHPFTLQFKKRVMARATDPSDESVYMHRAGAHFGADSRRPIAAAMMFYLIEAIFEYFDGPENGRDAAIVFAFRYGFILFAAILLALSYTKHYARKAPIYNTIIFTLGMAEAIAVPSLRERDLNGRAVMVYIFCMTLLSNSSTLRFIPNLVVNSVGFIIWCIAANTRSITQRNLDSTSDGATFSFFVFAGSLCNIVASYVRENYQRRDFVLTRRVEEEKDRSNQFLFFTLPPFVAKSLREGHYGISEKCEGVTILYSDIKGFTKYSASSTPENVVQLLSQLFSAFDRLTEYHGVYKVQTIGDAYVIVAGFHFLDEEVQRRHRMTRKPDAADHANNMVRMAMDMLGVIKRVPTTEGSGVQMRLGIHTGEVIAGCIGTKQLRYDIWGNDCLVANSMESNGIPSGVVVSYSTAELIRTKYRLVRREPVVIKNKKYDNYAIQCPIDQPEKRLRTKYDEAAETAEEEKKARERAAMAPSTPSAFGARMSTMAQAAAIAAAAGGSAATTPKVGTSTSAGSASPAHAFAPSSHSHNNGNDHTNNATTPKAGTSVGTVVTPLSVELRPTTGSSGHHNDEKKR